MSYLKENKKVKLKPQKGDFNLMSLLPLIIVSLRNLCGQGCGQILLSLSFLGYLPKEDDV